MKHLFVINPKSFERKDLMLTVIEDIKKYFQDGENGEYYIYISRYPRDAVGEVIKHLKQTEDIVRVYAVGGDGILFDCLNGIINFPKAQLAAMPYGTSNDFVRSFGEGKESIFRDVEKQAKGDTIATDIIQVGDKCVLSICSVGIEAAAFVKYYNISKKYPSLGNSIAHNFSWIFILLALVDKKTKNRKYQLYIDGNQIEGDFLGIGLGNVPCNGIKNIPFPMAHPSDGILEVLTLSRAIGLRLLSMIKSYSCGEYAKLPKYIKHETAKEVKIKSDGPMYINLDGEVYTDTKVSAKLIPRAINFVAPEGLAFVRRQKYE